MGLAPLGWAGHRFGWGVGAGVTLGPGVCPGSRLWGAGVGVAGGGVGLGQGAALGAGEASATTAPDAPEAAGVAPDAAGAPTEAAGATDAAGVTASTLGAGVTGTTVGAGVCGSGVGAGVGGTDVTVALAAAGGAPFALGLCPRTGMTTTAIANSTMNMAQTRSVGAMRSGRRKGPRRARRLLNGPDRSHRGAMDRSARSGGHPSRNHGPGHIGRSPVPCSGSSSARTGTRPASTRTGCDTDGSARCRRASRPHHPSLVPRTRRRPSASRRSP